MTRFSSDTNYDTRRTREAAERMMEHKVRGVAIMTSEISLRLVHELARRMIAVTFLDLAPVRGFTSNLRIDYLSGVEQIVKYLYENGHRQHCIRGGKAGTEVESGETAGLRKIDAAVWDWSQDRCCREICDSKADWLRERQLRNCHRVRRRSWR